MRVRYIYSACVVIETSSTSVVCDPWFTDGAFYGSWYQYPKFTGDPVSLIGKVDAIYVSHIHADHYDPTYLKAHLARYPDTMILIADHSPPLLRQRMIADGFKPTVCPDSTRIGDLELAIFPNHAHGELLDIDSAIAFRHNDRIVVNMNDNAVDMNQIQSIKEWSKNERPALGLFTYVGAVPFPQMYWYKSESERNKTIASMNGRGLGAFARYVDIFDPHVAMPFAGQYWLGGSLIPFNKKRWLVDAIDAKEHLSSRAIVLGDSGQEFFDCDTLNPSEERKKRHELPEVIKYLEGLPFEGFAFEQQIKVDAESLPLKPLIFAASTAAHHRARIPLKGEVWLCIRPFKHQAAFCLRPAKGPEVHEQVDLADLVPREEISLDPRLLYGLLTRLYNWDNAYIGSHLRFARVPDEYHPDLLRWLNFFHV